MEPNAVSNTPQDHAYQRLSAELQAALVRELQSTYSQLNHQHFKGSLRAAAIKIGEGRGRLGLWSSSSRVIEIARFVVLDHPWCVVVEVLKHEMAHQYVHEVLRITDETAHGPAFRDVCKRLGIDATAAGMPRVAGSESENETRVLERIARLLALAESPNEHEAHAAMSAAQRLMLKYNLENVRAKTEQTYSFRHIGTPVPRTSEAGRILGGILAKHFFVEVIWVPVFVPLEGKRATVLEASGTVANLEMAAYVHAYVMHTAEQLWVQHRRARKIGNRDRRTFMAGVMTGFLEKLDAERAASREEGLVWVKDADLHAYHRKRFPHIQTIRHAGNRRTEAHAHGREAGRNIVLRKPVSSGSNGGPAPQLPRGRS